MKKVKAVGIFALIISIFLILPSAFAAENVDIALEGTANCTGTFGSFPCPNSLDGDINTQSMNSVTGAASWAVVFSTNRSIGNFTVMYSSGTTTVDLKILNSTSGAWVTVKTLPTTGGQGTNVNYTSNNTYESVKAVNLSCVSGCEAGVAEWGIRNATLTGDTTPPEIEILTYNLTSDGGLGCTNWNTDKNNACTTADTTPTVKITLNENASCAIGIADLNYTAMGASRDCGGGAGTKLTCTLTSQDELTNETSYMYIGCKDASNNENKTSTSGPLKVSIHTSDLERYGRTAIENGIKTALSGQSYSLYTDQKIYARNSVNNQLVGRFDKVVKWLNKIWAFNFLTGNETAVNMFNITPVLYTLEMRNMTNSTINTTVYNFITSIK